MKKTLVVVLVLTLGLAMALSLTACQRTVKVLTGEIVICTAGEIVEDDTREVEVPEDEVEQYGVTTTVITCDDHTDLGTLYGQAQEAIGIGDLVVARERLTTIVQRDPGYRNARQQLDAIGAGNRPQPDTGDQAAGGGTGGTQPAQPPAADPVGPIVSLTKFVPDSIAGYVAQGILADVASLSRQYLPIADKVDQLVIEVEQRVSADAAVAAQKNIISAYSTSRGTRTVGGRTVMVGSYGNYAAAVFTDGALTVTVELHGSGTAGSSLIDDAIAVVDSVAR
ncbi:MAG: hypothetical protein ACYC6J_07285 [Coriobacteriia bacterium]